MIQVSGTSTNQINESTINRLLPIAARLAAGDFTIWQDPSESVDRMDWIYLPSESRDLLPQIDALTAWARSNELTHILLCGMGGSSLAADVIAKSYKKKLTILDSSDPGQVINSTTDLKKTLIIIASKSGTTIETTSHLKYFVELFKGKNLDPIDHMIIITDPATALDVSCRGQGFKVINANPNVGGRYSALSAFGLIPAALAGVDVSVLLDDAEEAARNFATADSPAILIAALLFDRSNQIVNFIATESSALGLFNWVEQLIAESTGKNGKGRLPVPITKISDRRSELVVGFSNSDADLNVVASLGEQFILWQWVTSLLSFLLEVNPFNQPNVAESKKITSELLAAKSEVIHLTHNPSFETKHYLFYSDAGHKTLKAFLASHCTYFSVMAYLDKFKNKEIQNISSLIGINTDKPVTFGWGPSFLHSTGQIHKGGQPNGAFIQITADCEIDVPVPGEAFTFAQLLAAQASADAQALASANLAVIRIHLKNRDEGIKELLSELA